FIPKLTQRFNENGNHGIDFYEYCLEDENPEVVYVGLDRAEEEDETPLESDRGSCTCNGVDHCHCDSDRSCTDACKSDLGYNPNLLSESDKDIDLRDQSY